MRGCVFRTQAHAMCRRTANDSGAADNANNAVAVRSGGLKHRRSMHSRRMRRPHVPACFPPKGEIFRESPRRRPEPFQNAFENDQGIRRQWIDHCEVEASSRRGRLEFAEARRRDAGAIRRAQRRCRFASVSTRAQRSASRLSSIGSFHSARRSSRTATTRYQRPSSVSARQPLRSVSV
ncbi:hypothetical protein Y027_5903 [Burkholderia pseudomallei TSV5]|nr:hypothetical protein Y027_5903 [Burkholderia pseudomallei TSV5]